MKLYIEEAIKAAMEGDVKGAFEVLFQDLTANVKSPVEFFEELIDYLRRTLGVGSY